MRRAPCVSSFRSHGRRPEAAPSGATISLSSAAWLSELPKVRGEIGDAFANDDIAMPAFSVYWYRLRDWANEEIDEQAFAVRLRPFFDMQLKSLAAS